MPQTSSDFVVKVSTQGVDQARRALDALGAATDSIGTDQSKAFASATQSLEKMIGAVDRLTQRMERAALSVKRLGRASSGSSSAHGVVSVTGVVPGPATVPGAVPGIVPGAGTSVAPTSGVSAMDMLQQRNQAWQSVYTANFGTNRANSSVSGVLGASMYGARAGTTSAYVNPDVKSSTSQRSHAFGLGLLQGLLPSQLSYVQRGQGAIGQMLGQTAGGVLSSAARMPFSGSQGLVNFVGSAPGGGLLAAPLGHYLAQAEQSMSFQRQQMEMMPLLGAQSVQPDAGMSASYVARQAQRQGLSLAEAERRAAPLRNQRLTDDIRSKGSAGIRLMGADIGQSLAFSSSLAANGGNRADQMTDAFRSLAMATKTNLGIGAETTGAFALGARTDAVAGKGNTAESLLLKALSQAKQLNLSGADEQQYLQQIAEGIRQFQQTGMPLQMDSVRGLTEGFEKMGLSKVAAQRSAFNMQNTSSEFFQRGPQNAFDMQVMRSGGFSGGLKSYYDTRLNLAKNPTQYTEGVMGALGSLARGPIRSKNIMNTYNAMRSQGIDASIKKATEFVDRVNNKEDTSDFAKDVANAQRPGQAQVTQASAESEAAGKITGTMTSQAAMANANVARGNDASSIAVELDGAANDTTNAVVKFAGVFSRLAKAVHSTTDAFVGGNSMNAAPPNVQPGH